MAEETFEGLFAALEERTRKLEQGNLPLEDSLRLYEEGAALADKLRTILEGAELRVRTVRARLNDEQSPLSEPELTYDEPFDE
ncbi:MAG: exodeoxyribonuclease VII small subunit [Vicinamibacterales bacterium]